MRVVVEGEASRELPVASGVPQGTVLGPVLFLCHINDLPDCVRSQVRLFADDCLLYRTIRTWKDHITLQEDLECLEEWATRWGMRFNASKCYILSVNNNSSHFYSVNNHFLKQVATNPYLSVTFSEDLKWSPHIKPALVEPVTCIINEMFRDSSFPADLKVARVLPIFKKEDALIK